MILIKYDITLARLQTSLKYFFWIIFTPGIKDLPCPLRPSPAAMQLVLPALLPYICMAHSAIKTVSDFHTSSLGNLTAFTEKEAEAKGSLELARSHG